MVATERDSYGQGSAYCTAKPWLQFSSKFSTIMRFTTPGSKKGFHHPHHIDDEDDESIWCPAFDFCQLWQKSNAGQKMLENVTKSSVCLVVQCVFHLACGRYSRTIISQKLSETSSKLEFQDDLLQFLQWKRVRCCIHWNNRNRKVSLQRYVFHIPRILSIWQAGYRIDHHAPAVSWLFTVGFVS